MKRRLAEMESPSESPRGRAYLTNRVSEVFPGEKCVHARSAAVQLTNLMMALFVTSGRLAVDSPEVGGEGLQPVTK